MRRLLSFLRALYRRLSGYTPRLTSWVWCPNCRHNLNGDEASFQGYNDRGLVVYECALCAHRSSWDFDAPAPLLIEGEVLL